MIEVQHHFGGGTYAKETRIPEGMVLVQHRHKHDHLSILAKGNVVLFVEGVRSILNGPCVVEIQAGQHHAVRAITDAVWYCIHATKERDAEQLDQQLILDPEDMKAIADSM